MFCMSCLQDDNPDVVEGVGIDAKEDITAQKLWVCHHPGSKFHNQLCVDDLYPNGCYVYGDSHNTIGVNIVHIFVIDVINKPVEFIFF